MRGILAVFDRAHALPKLGIRAANGDVDKYEHGNTDQRHAAHDKHDF